MRNNNRLHYLILKRLLTRRLRARRSRILFICSSEQNMSSRQLSDKLATDGKSEEIVRIINSEENINNEQKDDVNQEEDHLDDDERNEDEFDSPALRQTERKITYLANVELFIAVLSIAVSSFLLACASCGTLGASAGSGVWCPVFFLVFAAMCRGNTQSIHPSKIICIFGGAAAYFAVLMFGIETLEVTQAFNEEPFHASAASLHIVLCCIAATEFALIVATICIHMASGKNIKDTYNSVKTSANEYVLPRVLKGKKPQMI